MREENVSPNDGSYRSIQLLGPEETAAIAFICSDRRIRLPVEEFLAKHAGLSSYDTVAVPGGPFMLCPGDTRDHQKTAMRMIHALMKLHDPSRIILISHQHCGRYQLAFANEMRNPGFDLAARQRSDLGAVLVRVEREFPEAEVGAFFAVSNDDDTVIFESVG